MHSNRSSEDMHQLVVQLADHGRDCVLAMVLEAEGSTPCRVGAKAIMDAEGVMCGTIGGGFVEAETQRRAAETIKVQQPVILNFDLDSRAVDDAAPICGGAVRVLMDPTVVRHRESYATASAIRRSRRRGVLLTSIRGPNAWEIAVEFLPEPAVHEGRAFPGAGELRDVLERERPRLFVSESPPEGQQLEVFVEPVIPKPLTVIVGGGHIGQAVAAQARLVGFDIVVIDDRPEFTRSELFPDGATTRCGEISEEVAGFPLGGDTYVVIVTHGHMHDAEALAACIHQPVSYIGMIGSQRKVAMMRRDFVESGRATSAVFDRVYAPIGLDLGSVTVPEIAASIVAQLIAVRRKGSSPRILAR